MAIAIVSDLVLDVVRAADPERAKIAQAGLQRGAADKALAAEFADVVNLVRSNESISHRAGKPSSAGENGIPALNEIARRTSPKEKAYEQFEATVLRSFVEEMLPKSTENTYGEGTAGGVWRSMQADFMSQELAKSGGIGIAASLARLDHSKTQALSGAHLNSISPRADGGASIVHSIEWPYFGSSKMGVLES
jgi:peptidoglycan hydrolase FlgJ